MRLLKITLSLTAFAAMLAASAIHFYYAGMGGLAGCALGFMIGMLWPGHHDVKERVGTAYIVALSAMSVCFSLVALCQFIYFNFADWLTAVAQIGS